MNRNLIQRIIIGLAIGTVFAVSSYIIGVIVTAMFVCCFESNVFMGLLIVGPQVALLGGMTGFLFGYNLHDFRHFAASWQRSHKFKAVVFVNLLLSLIWFGFLFSWPLQANNQSFL